MHARVEGSRASVPVKEARNVGVTKAALLVFNNFVAQIAATAPTLETMKTCTTELRRSKRLCQQADEVVPPAPPPLAPLQPLVRALRLFFIAHSPSPTVLAK